MNYSNVTRAGSPVLSAYIVDLLQGQRIDPSTLPPDVELAQLMPVGLDRADFLDGVLVAHPVKVVLDAALHCFRESVMGIDVDGVAIPA